MQEESSSQQVRKDGSGTLILVATPLGNRQDWSPRARATVLSADLLLCEDTRSPTRLFGENESLPPRISCFAHNEAQRIETLLEALRAGKKVVFMSEAGMPVVSDPGQLLVQAAWEHGFAVDCIPGPCAATTALCLSGFAATDSRFIGFLPRSGSDRTAALQKLEKEAGACVFYEAGNRVRDLLRDLQRELAAQPERRLFIGRELTKVHQELVRATLSELIDREFESRGEFTLVLEGYRGKEPPLDEAEIRRQAAAQVIETLLDPAMRPREKARTLAQLGGGDAREIYAALFGRDSQ
jgi:16S rRNA (cytidine1402-2'-O)-methyltransferase